jgi:hypothetical protein
MLAAQIGEKLCGGSGTPGSYIFVAVTDALDGSCEILALPLQVSGQSIVQRRSRVLPAPFGVLSNCALRSGLSGIISMLTFASPHIS